MSGQLTEEKLQCSVELVCGEKNFTGKEDTLVHASNFNCSKQTNWMIGTFIKVKDYLHYTFDVV